MQVIVFDDTRQVRERLAAIIGAIRGVTRVSQAADGMDALVQIDGTAPDVIVLDIAMPVLNGLGVLDGLAARRSRVPVIVLSNRSEYRDHALRLGAAFFFDKTTEMDLLVATLTSMATAEGEPC